MSLYLSICNNKYMKYYDQNKELSYLQYWDVSNLYGWAKSQTFKLNNFEWMKDSFQFSKKRLVRFYKKL